MDDQPLPVATAVVQPNFGPLTSHPLVSTSSIDWHDHPVLPNPTGHLPFASYNHSGAAGVAPVEIVVPTVVGLLLVVVGIFFFVKWDRKKHTERVRRAKEVKSEGEKTFVVVMKERQRREGKDEDKPLLSVPRSPSTPPTRRPTFTERLDLPDRPPPAYLAVVAPRRASSP